MVMVGLQGKRELLIIQFMPAQAAKTDLALSF